MPRSRLGPLVPVLVLVVLLRPLVGSAQQDDGAQRARLLADFARTRDPSTGCSLGEVERRLGMLDEAARHLDAVLDAVDVETIGPVTLSACRFNRARVFEAQGQLDAAMARLADARATPDAERRGIVERALVSVASRVVTQSGCDALDGRFSAQGLLRFGEDRALRRCAAEARRARPFCEAVSPGQVSGLLTGRTRTIDAQTQVTIHDGDLIIARRGPQGGAVISAQRCALPNEDEYLRMASVVDVGGTRLLDLRTQMYVSYACGCDEGEDDGDCRCEETAYARYLLAEDGALLLAITDPSHEREPAVTWREDAPALREAAASSIAPITVEGDVLVMDGRRLVVRDGALVPAPPAP